MGGASKYLMVIYFCKSHSMDVSKFPAVKIFGHSCVKNKCVSFQPVNTNRPLNSSMRNFLGPIKKVI